MAWTRVAANDAADDATSGTVVDVFMAGTPSVGNVVCVAALWFGGGASGTSASCQDSNGKTYTAPPSNSPSTYDTNAGQIFLFYRVITGGESGQIIVTFVDTIVVASMRALEFTPPSGTATFGAATKGTGTGTAVNTPTGTVVGSDDLMFGGTAYSSNISSVNSPWTATLFGAPGSFGEGYCYDLSVASNQAADYTGDNAGATWSGAIMSFNIGGGGGGTADTNPPTRLRFTRGKRPNKYRRAS
jgi:hypothetical protein